MSFVDLLHSFFYFLGTTEGELLKTAIELVLFTIVTYMITSEYLRLKRKEYQFLIIGFGAMALVKIFSVYTIATAVFIRATPSIWAMHTLENFAEIMALFLIANAFVYPLIKQRKLDTGHFVLKSLLILLSVSIVFSLVMLSIIDLRGGMLTDFWTNTSINVAEIVVLIFYASYLMAYTKYRIRYRGNIIAAMVLYAITPTIELINILFYDNLNKSLLVASHPFPFISILLFTQVIFLKLADKAKILHKLRKSEQMYAHEKEVSNLKDSFISTVSHELKTPLTSMKLYVGLLKDKKLGPIERKQSKALGVVNDECDRLNKLITDILDLSKLDAKKQKLELSEFDLGEIVADEMYLALAAKKKVEIKFEIPRNFTIVADKDKLKQVFINLFNNALKFTPEKGRITIKSRELAKEWEFAVEDTGQGIEKEHLPKLFSRFYQAENIMTRTQGGFGLGLSIVKNIVDMHGGRIAVDSEIGKGTKISIRLPKKNMY